MSIFSFFHSFLRRPPAKRGRWTLVPLGNPSEDYGSTRHNLGRLLLERWIKARQLEPQLLEVLPDARLVALPDGLQVLLPSTYMNESGYACAQARDIGILPDSMILLHDDKDLPLGLGRFRLEGSDGGHNGLHSVIECLETSAIPRLRMGIGPFQRPLAEFVLGRWSEEEWEKVQALDAPFCRFMELLATTERLATLGVRVNTREFWMASDKGL